MSTMNEIVISTHVKPETFKRMRELGEEFNMSTARIARIILENYDYAEHPWISHDVVED